jgi:hypothetical protein
MTPTVVSQLLRFTGSHALASVPLQIDGSDIKFLRDALRQGCRFSKLTLRRESDAATEPPALWQLEFFTQTRFAVTFLLIARAMTEADSADTLANSLFSELARLLGVDPKARVLFDSGRVIWQHAELAQLDAVPATEAVMTASVFLRGTKSLAHKDFSERAKRWLALDPRGLALISKIPNAAVIAQRYSMLLALLRAYQFAIDGAVDQLAQLAAQREQRSDTDARQGTDASTALSMLQRDTLVFAARFLFARPVRLDTVDLRYVWAALAQENHLQESHAELTEQLDAIHSLLMHDEERAESARRSTEELREKRGQHWLSLIGLSLAMLSLLSLVEVTPEKLHAFWRAWFG